MPEIPPIVEDPAGAGSPGPADRVVDLQIERELKDSYLTYAMSTIVDRALPDVRDGLKPSQRRILVAMNDLNLGPRAKHRKCAKICGDVSGNYHPHGEAVIYPTLVRFGQDWVMSTELIDKQGNFGSMHPDPPAAMRYTEARMTEASVDMLEDLKLDTVDFKPNYDDTREEPMVLPAKFPNLLVNGSTGIAVGMACSIPPHNPGEICNAIVAVIDNPEISLAELMERVPGPDFPTGGVICGRSGIRKAYATGRGRISVRGRVHVEESATGRQSLVIDDVPYHVVHSVLIDKITEGYKNDKIQDISDVRDESGRRARSRIVIELKKGADPAVVENQLYQFTPLQSTFSIINIALVNGQPRTLSLRQLIDCYIEHRIEVIRRRTAHKLKEARKKAHILEGLIYAVCDIDEVIRLIRSSRTRDEAIERLMERAFRITPEHKYAAAIPAKLLLAAGAAGGVRLTRVQAEAIGRLQLIQLVGLEIEKLTGDYRGLVEEIEGYEAVLASHELVLDIIREDVLEMKNKHERKRLTEISEVATDLEDADLIADEAVVVTISHEGYIKRVALNTYREQGRGGKGIKGSESKENDFIEHLFVASTHDDLLCFTNTGRVFRMKVYEVPEMSRTAKGRAIVNLLDLKEGETLRAALNIKDFEKSEDYLTFATSGGIVKRTALKEYRNVHRSGINAINLREGDRLVDVIQTTGGQDLLLATAEGMAIRFDEQDVRVMGRNAGGVKGITLGEGDEVVGLVLAADDKDLLTVCENGYGKRTAMTEYKVQSDDGSSRTQSRGGKGRIDIRTTERNGRVVSVVAVSEEDGLILITQGGMIVRIRAASVSRIGRATQGVRVASLNEGDRLISVARVVESEENGESGNGGAPG